MEIDNMRKVEKVLLLVAMLSLLTGCSGSAVSDTEFDNLGVSEVNIGISESTENNAEEQNKEITKEVVFYNKEYDKYRVGVLIKRNHMISLYEEELDSNKLYAFEISVECNRNGNMDYSEDYSSILKTLLQKEGLLIVKDYPSDNIVVAGTMEELKHIFEETDHLDGWCLRAEVAVRPDKEPTEGEETQVTLTVPVIMPEETTEQN